MYSSLSYTILPPLSPTIYFHAFSIPGAPLEHVTEPFLYFVAPRWLFHGLPNVTTEDYPNIRDSLLRPESISIPPAPDRPRARKTGPTRRFCCTRRRYHFWPTSTDRGWGFHLQATRTIGLSPRQLDNVVVVTTLQVCHFDVSVATFSSVSWS